MLVRILLAFVSLLIYVDCTALPLVEYYFSAQEYEPEYKKLKEEKKIEIDEASSGYKEYLPEISASYDYSYSETNDSGQISTYSSQGDYRRRSMSGRIVQPVFDKRKIENISGQNVNRSLYWAEIEVGKTELLNRVFNAYRSYYLSGISLDNAIALERIEKTRLDQVRKGLKLGVSKDIELLEAEVSYLQAQANAKRYFAEVHQAETDLKSYSGYSELSVGSECDDSSHYTLPVVGDDITQSALVSPEVELLKRRSEQLESELDIAKSELYPSVYLSYERSRSETINGSFDGSINNMSVSQVGIDIPIYPSYAPYSRISSYSQKTALYAELLAMKRIESLKRLKNILVKYNNFTEAYEATSAAFNRSAELLSVREQEFELGQISSVELDEYTRQHIRISESKGEACMNVLGVRVDISIKTGDFDYLFVE